MSTKTTGIEQTILHSDPKRPGNCLAACVATFLGIELKQVPHFVEFGAHWNGDDDRAAWWAMLCGFMAGRGLWVTELDSLDQVTPGEVAFVSGPSPRGAFHHQVLYRDGQLWHDPHPSSIGLLSISAIEVWRSLPEPGFDHTPSQRSPEQDQ